MLVYVQQSFDKVKITNWKLLSKDPLDQKPATSSQASSQSQSGAEDDNDLRVEFLPITTNPTGSALRHSLLKKTLHVATIKQVNSFKKLKTFH